MEGSSISRIWNERRKLGFWNHVFRRLSIEITKQQIFVAFAFANDKSFRSLKPGIVLADSWVDAHNLDFWIINSATTQRICYKPTREMTSLPMTTCANCGKHDGRDGISLKRCLGCRMVKYCNRECQLAHRSSHKIGCRQQAAKLREDELQCVICLDKMPDDNGNPVRSGVCACRGDSGCFHLSCLVKNAEGKTTEATSRHQVDLNKIW